MDAKSRIDIDAKVFGAEQSIMVVKAGWQAVVRLCSDEGETGIGWLGERHSEKVVPRSPQDIIGRKDGCDEWNSAKALMNEHRIDGDTDTSSHPIKII